MLVVALDRDEPVEQGAQISDAAGLELHRGDRRSRSTDERHDQSIVDGPVGDHLLDLAGDVDHVGIALRREVEFAAVNDHGATLADDSSHLIEISPTRGVGEP